MPITRISPDPDAEASTSADVTGNNEMNLDVFHVQEAFEVYDGPLALAIDHLLNHLKVLISLAYLPGSEDLQKALKRHPALRRRMRQLKQDQADIARLDVDGRSVDRVVLAECQRLMDGVMEIAHLAAWPETAAQAQVELELLQRDVPFLDYRYDNDPFPSDKDHEERE